MFDLLYDQSRETGKVFGYLATIATPEQYKLGRADLIVGALPEMTRNVVVEDVLFVDMPQVRGDSSVGAIVWTEEDRAQLVSISPLEGRILDSAEVALPPLKNKKISQGPGITDDPYLARRSTRDYSPRNVFAF